MPAVRTKSSSWGTEAQGVWRLDRADWTASWRTFPPDHPRKTGRLHGLASSGGDGLLVAGRVAIYRYGALDPDWPLAQRHEVAAFAPSPLEGFVFSSQTSSSWAAGRHWVAQLDQNMEVQKIHAGLSGIDEGLEPRSLTELEGGRVVLGTRGGYYELFEASPAPVEPAPVKILYGDVEVPSHAGPIQLPDDEGPIVFDAITLDSRGPRPSAVRASLGPGQEWISLPEGRLQSKAGESGAHQIEIQASFGDVTSGVSTRRVTWTVPRSKKENSRLIGLMLVIGTLLAGASGLGILLQKKRGQIHTLEVRTEQLVERRTNAEAQLDELIQNTKIDSLTGLPNRSYVMSELRSLLSHAWERQLDIALLFIDLDNFKLVNDTLGHSRGDVLLRLVAKRLKGQLRRSDTVGRLGGDEFVIVAPAVTGDGRRQAKALAERVLASLEDPVSVEGREIFARASIGIAIGPEDGATEISLLKNADAALYASKNEGRARYSFFSNEMNERAIRRLVLEAALRSGLDNQGFSVVYHPIVDSESQQVQAFEALMRFSHPELGMVSPVEFIPIAEETGLIIDIGRFILETALDQVAVWRRRPGHEHLQVGVNVTPRQLQESDFVQTVEGALEARNLEPDSLIIEITESSMLSSGAESGLHELGEIGISLAVDDFGTGYSSLSYLHKFPFTSLKIDQAFVRHLSPEDHRGVALVRAILSMSRSLGLSVTAEGVETSHQASLLHELSCNRLQGYHFGRPAPADQWEDYFRPQLQAAPA